MGNERDVAEHSLISITVHLLSRFAFAPNRGRQVTDIQDWLSDGRH
jgi:hypothetical protein